MEHRFTTPGALTLRIRNTSGDVRLETVEGEETVVQLEASRNDDFSNAAVELNAQLPNGHVEVRLAGRDPELVYVEDAPREAQPQPAAAEEGASARITLRLADALKDQVEAAAASGGVSVNTWIVRTLARAVTTPARRSRNRLTGFAES